MSGRGTVVFDEGGTQGHHCGQRKLDSGILVSAEVDNLEFGQAGNQVSDQAGNQVSGLEHSQEFDLVDILVSDLDNLVFGLDDIQVSG